MSDHHQQAGSEEHPAAAAPSSAGQKLSTCECTSQSKGQSYEGQASRVHITANFLTQLGLSYPFFN